MKKLVTTLTLMAATLTMTAQVPAFPGAEGHGRYVTGGRGGEVYHVTNLNDSGTGSLRDAVSKKGRIVVFDVGGVIALKSDLTFKDNITIAGQTAPYPGITVRYYTVRPGTNNIIRFMRFRRGQEKDYNDGADAIWQRNKTGIILDHCSFSWSIDEVASFYDNNNFTMQWCTIGESLNNAGHGKGAHGYGGIWGGKLASFHHNLICHVNNRSPRFNGARYNWNGFTGNQLYTQYNWNNTLQAEIVDFRNCVIYNCGNGCYGGPGGGYVNMINNYYKTGPAGSTNRVTSVSLADSGNSGNDQTFWGMTSRYFIDGNTFANQNGSINNTPSKNNWNAISYDDDVINYDGQRWTKDPQHYYGNDVGYTKINNIDCVPIKLSEPVVAGDITTHDAIKAFDKVIDYAGASLTRDDVDTRYMEETKNGTATYKGSVTKKAGRIDLVADVNGYTEANFPTGKRDDDFDKDNDGIDDAWELANGLDPNNAADAHLYTIDTEKKWYTNLEVYLNALVEDIMRQGNADSESSVNEYYPACNRTLAGTHPLLINEENFPDATFRANISEWADSDGDGALSDDELAAVVTWELHDVENFKGLEYFTSLATLWIAPLWKEGPLNATNLDLSALTNLWRIGIGDYNITSFDVSANTKVTDLEIANCPKLASIKAPADVEVFTFTNLPSLASMDFSPYKKLTTIFFLNVGVQDFDFSSHPAIARINLSGSEEELYTLNSINVAGCPELYEISFEWTKTQSIRLKNLPKLYALAFNNCETALIAVEEMPELGGISCANSNIKELNIKSCPELTGVNCNDNRLQTLIIDDSPKLGTVYAKDNYMMWLDLQYVKNEEGGTQNWFNVEGQQPRATAYKLKSDAVGLKVHERFEKERMLNLKTNSKDMTPDWLTVDGVKYLVISTDGSTADNLKNKKATYKYETKWPFPWAGENPEDNNMPVELTLSGVEKLNSWIKFKTSDFDEPLKGEEGGTLVGATPEDIARSDYYDGALTFTSSDKDVVSVNVTTGALTLVGAGVATITISGAETYYRNAPMSIDYKVIVYALGDVNWDGKIDIVDVTSVISHILGQTPDGFHAAAADVNGDGKVDIVDVTSIIDLILK